jgi:hypothetical protein
MPYSKLKARVADILKAEGFIAGWKEEEAEVGKKLTRSPPTCRTCWVAWVSQFCPPLPDS